MADAVVGSILNDIKKMLGPDVSETIFDPDLIININSTISILTQLGVGPSTGFSITDADGTWDSFMGSDKRLSFVKTYIYIKTKLVFDPPLNSAILDSMKSTAAELEWRICNAAEEITTT